MRNLEDDDDAIESRQSRRVASKTAWLEHGGIRSGILDRRFNLAEIKILDSQGRHAGN